LPYFSNNKMSQQQTMEKDIIKLLDKNFGYKKFRGNQEEIIETILKKKDCLVLMPTGGGKSLCYQIPALALEGTTLVISPLISLMKDQVDSLTLNDIPSAYYNSSLSDTERSFVIKEALSGKLKLLYLSPESAVNAIDQWLREVKIPFIAIDEAHCISMWGHDFRPEYQQLKNLRNYFPDVTISAFTATAEFSTIKDIDAHLGLKEATHFVSSFDRPNITLTIKGRVPKKKKLDEIEEYIQQKGISTSGIIYCLSRKDTEQMAVDLLSRDIDAVAYHAGMTTEERSKIQDDFINDRKAVICATTAFGMGIDKSNVRWVIHNSLPKNIESYYQEFGRAGRDGLKAEAILYYNYGDVFTLSDFITKGTGEIEAQLEKLNRMVQLAEATSCRRILLLAYFGEYTQKECGNCDNCKKVQTLINATEIYQKAISAILRCNQEITLRTCIDVLKGRLTSDIQQHNYHLIKTFGAGKEITHEAWNHYLISLKNAGLLRTDYSNQLKLKVTSSGLTFLKEEKKLLLPIFEPKKDVKGKLPIQAPGKLPPNSLLPQEILFNHLKIIRKSIAVAENKPAYLIFSDATLEEMAINRPQNEDEMLLLNGVGEKKMEMFGKLFLAEVLRLN
jgi:ATP-dependent DNA helicase RecQ